jgi:predicted PurR-regulated permease PerM
MPAISMKISERLHDLSLSLKGMGIALPENLNKDFITDWVNKHTDVIYNFASGFAMNLWDIVLVLFYLFFLLYYKDNTEHFFTAHIKDRRRLVVIRNRINESITLIRGYISGMVVLSLILAVMNLAVFLIFGLKFAFFFAVFLAILNLIPLIGNLIGLAFIMLFAIITKDNMVVPLLILVSLFIVNFLQDNVIRPWLMGDKLKINAFSVFLAIIIGGMIWGVSGMILFIPIVGTIKIMLENNEKHGSYAIFFSEVPKKHKTKVHEDEDEAESTN